MAFGFGNVEDGGDVSQEQGRPVLGRGMAPWSMDSMGSEKGEA